MAGMGGGTKVAGKVLDMGCGKGGDLTKWAKARIKEYFGVGAYSFRNMNPIYILFMFHSCGVDIAAVSVDQARDRYGSLRPPKFKANFYASDCYSLPLSSALPPLLAQEVLPSGSSSGSSGSSGSNGGGGDNYYDSSGPRVAEFDVVSMQFCMHYAFESEEKTRVMLGNVARWLRRGGVFVGTIPNAEQLLCVSSLSLFSSRISSYVSCHFLV